MLYAIAMGQIKILFGPVKIDRDELFDLLRAIDARVYPYKLYERFNSGSVRSHF